VGEAVGVEVDKGGAGGSEDVEDVPLGQGFFAALSTFQQDVRRVGAVFSQEIIKREASFAGTGTAFSACR
jgi:hypothetical protein